MLTLACPKRNNKKNVPQHFLSNLNKPTFLIFDEFLGACDK